jgi:dimeric dUTPase (all-alpha-NTP-PPase superfamily)
VDFRFRLPTFSVTDPETELTELTGSPSDVPPSESEVDSALVGQNAEQAGLESESQAFSAWQEGEPVETKADLDAYVENLEEKLQTTGDDAQLANVDLQNALQQQQQTLQMMSNISKMLHDTAMSILRKIGS